jgi:hypothetical protein
MYMPVHFEWKIETFQAYISIQYYARSAPFSLLWKYGHLAVLLISLD